MATLTAVRTALVYNNYSSWKELYLHDDCRDTQGRDNESAWELWNYYIERMNTNDYEVKTQDNWH